MAAFAGKYNATIDDKGRVVFPSALKKALGESTMESLIVEKNLIRNCLDIHPEKSWKKRVKDFESDLDPFDPEDDALREEFYESFTLISMASNGRINIPRDYLEFASLKKNVKFIGMNTSIRLVVGGEQEKPRMSREEYLTRLKEKRANRNMKKNNR